LSLAAHSNRLGCNVNDDELVEVTPKSIRIRKKLLTENERKRANR